MVGTVAQIPNNLLGSGRTLAIHMYALSGRRARTWNRPYATAVVLLVIVVALNALSGATSAHYQKYVGASMTNQNTT